MAQPGYVMVQGGAKSRGSRGMVEFNGSNTYLSILDDFTDDFETYPNDITAVWWMTSDVSTRMGIFGIVQGIGDSDGFRIEQQSNRALRVIVGEDVSGTNLNFESDNQNVISSGVACYMVSTNRGADGSGGTISVYRNDTQIAMSRNPTTTGNLDHGPGYFILGRLAKNFSSESFDGCINRVWIDQRTVDFSVEANRRKFVSASGQRVDYGTDGSKPFGTQPKIFINGDSSTITQHGSISFSSSNLTRSNLTDCTTTLP